MCMSLCLGSKRVSLYCCLDLGFGMSMSLRF